MDWKKALKLVVGIPETAKGASSLGEIPAGTEETVELPAGELKISYAESTNPPTDASGGIVFPAPEGFSVAVATTSGEQLEVREPGRVNLGAQMNKLAWREIGHVTIPAAGSYVISSTPAPGDRKEPRVFLAPK
jgi:hypothetical protein